MFPALQDPCNDKCVQVVSGNYKWSVSFNIYHRLLNPQQKEAFYIMLSSLKLMLKNVVRELYYILHTSMMLDLQS